MFDVLKNVKKKGSIPISKATAIRSDAATQQDSLNLLFRNWSSFGLKRSFPSNCH
uniref:Uncharacterized protein n=1 Tax=Rhizophora mucronata TaxID=61149 RepID=A0A2P2J533_RHIMU